MRIDMYDPEDDGVQESTMRWRGIAVGTLIVVVGVLVVCATLIGIAYWDVPVVINEVPLR